MKDSIVLHKAAFERWWNRWLVSADSSWQSLVEESEKPERLVRYVVTGGKVFNEAYFADEDKAKEFAKDYGDVIKLVEEVQP